MALRAKAAMARVRAKTIVVYHSMVGLVIQNQMIALAAYTVFGQTGHGYTPTNQMGDACKK